MTLPNGFVFRASTAAGEAGVGARPENGQLARPGELQVGVIVENEGGTYAVGLLDEQGRIVARYPRTRVMGTDPGLSADDLVLIRFLGPIPQIIATGGGGCASGLTDFGVLID